MTTSYRTTTTERNTQTRKGNYLLKIIILSYAPAICWFGYIQETLILERAYLALLLLVFIGVSFSNAQRILLTPVHFILFIWLAWAGITCILANDMNLALSKLFACITRIGAATIILSFIYRLNAYRYLVWSFVISAIGSAILLFLAPGMVTDLGGRLYGTVANANTFGVQISAAICCLLYLFMETDENKIIWWFIYSVLMVLFIYMIILSGSRKAAVGVLLIFSVIGFQYSAALAKVSIMKAISLVLVGVFASIIMVFAVLQSDHADRYIRLYDGYVLGQVDRVGRSEEGRALMYELGWQAGMESPVFGIGLDNFRTLRWTEMAGSVGTYAHSNYIELLVGTGILGLIIYYSAWVVVLFRSLNRSIRRRVAAQISFALLIIMFAYDFAAVSYYNKVAWVIYALILAGVYGFRGGKVLHPTK